MVAPSVTAPDAYESSLPVKVKRFRLNALIIIGATMVLLFIAVTIIGKIKGTNPLTQTIDFNAPPSLHHWFGTDSFGRDLFARSASGAMVSLEVAIGSVLVVW